ncbi:BcsR/BcsP family cellulose biosynthesis protein [Halomonas sp. GXIMD04776]|uniref:BcsR/BcsP family cellulose biosynthesis protein n=1 Tax=Halomonas sp. GXIMD04776 TaxID=3415605 RepID=UPI003CAD73EE
MIKEKSFIKTNQKELIKYDEDIYLLLEKSDLTEFNYRNLAQLERIKAIAARWPLLAELRLQHRDPSQ